MQTRQVTDGKSATQLNLPMILEDNHPPAIAPIMVPRSGAIRELPSLNIDPAVYPPRTTPDTAPVVIRMVLPWKSGEGQPSFRILLASAQRQSAHR